MLILASASPRRRELLTLLCGQLGLRFCARPADVDETRLPGESPAEMAVRLALLKADTVYARAAESAGVRVLGGDTLVALGDEVLGKPADRAHAFAMLQRLSGKTHLVFSAVALVDADGRRHRLSRTEVTFGRIAAADLQRYCAGEEALDKAGGYAIQGDAGVFVQRVNGSYSGAVGLPLWETGELLRGE